MNKKLKITIISVVSVVLVVAIVVGIFWFLGRKTEPVKVAPVEMFTGWLNNDSSQSGMVTADKLQKVYPSSTQTITEMLVSEGQAVKIGDPLLRYDTTLSDIELERQRIAVQQAELDLQRANRDLAQINAMKPYTPPPTTEPTTEPSTQEPIPIAPEELPYWNGGEGTQEAPYRYLCAGDMLYDEAFLSGLLGENAEVWVAFEVRENNALTGELLNRWGLRLSRNAETTALQFSVFVPTDAPEENEDDIPDNGTDWVDDSSGFTAAEIAKMRAEKQKEIRDLELEKRMAAVELERMENEVANGYVYATIDGTVMGVRDAETAIMTDSPVLTVSGGGCYYIETAVTEFEREMYPAGTEVRVMSWMSGETTGTIEEISETPISDGYYYTNGNPNTTFYKVLVAVDAEAQLREGDYVDVYFSSNAVQTSGLCIESRFIREDEGGSYVFKRGEDNKLHKQYVRTGAIQWGYTVISRGLSAEDWIAFPYGKNVVDGADTVESNDWEDFNYYGSY